jgi:hypothetical protein
MKSAPLSPTRNVSALAREHGVSRSTIRRRLANGWTPAATQGIEVLPPAPPVVRQRPGVAAVLVIVAINIAVLALVINAQAGWRFSTTPLASWTFAGLSVAADLLAIVLPTAALALWRTGRPGVAALAWLTWTVAATLATLASVGFVELHTSDTAAGRRAIVATSTAITDQRTAAIAAALLAADAARKAREAECESRGPRCRDRESDERTALATVTSAIAVPVPAIATIADPDPQVTAALRLARWIGFDVTTAGVVNLRLALMATLPNIAGLVLAFGIVLRGRT